MPLIDDIQELRDRVVAELDTAFDYYTDTKIAWNLVLNLITSGHTFKNTNKITGTVTTQIELSAKARGYVTEQLTEATFQQFISIFENFYFEILRLWLTAYPRSLGAKTVDFKTVLDSADKDAITQFIVIKEVNELLYKRPKDWFSYLGYDRGMM